MFSTVNSFCYKNRCFTCLPSFGTIHYFARFVKQVGRFDLHLIWKRFLSKCFSSSCLPLIRFLNVKRFLSLLWSLFSVPFSFSCICFFLGCTSAAIYQSPHILSFSFWITRFDENFYSNCSLTTTTVDHIIMKTNTSRSISFINSTWSF